jgi:sulfur-oxidizing protein SoxZ
LSFSKAGSMTMSRPRIRLPDTAKVGEIIEVKTLINHVMETGQRREKDGKLVPRLIIHTFTAKFAGKTVFIANLQPGTSSNPFIAFHMRVPGPGSFEFTWEDDAGQKVVETQALKVA